MTAWGAPVTLSGRYSCARPLTRRTPLAHRGGPIPLSDRRPVPLALLTRRAATVRSGACGCVSGSDLGMTPSMITMTTPRAGTG